MIHLVILSLASNYEQERNMEEARRRLPSLLTPVRYSDAIWTEPVGNSRPSKYLNQILFATTNLNAEQLQKELKALELHLGRTQEDRHEGIVRIDLDLLMHDEQRYHLKDWERPYVKALL